MVNSIGNIELREAKSRLFCRGCDKRVKKGDDVIYTHSWRNCGQHIYFCMDCVESITKLRNSRLDKIITDLTEEAEKMGMYEKATKEL